MNLLKKTFSTAILIISFLLLIYTFYKSEIIWDGANRNYYKYYYLISLILICFSIITFFINNKIKQYLIISAISLFTSLYLFEGYLTFKKTKSQQLYEKETGKKWDTRNKLDIYKELKKKNNKIVVSFHPSHLVDKNYSTLPFPLSGVSNSETILCNENGYYAIYQSDRYGFNNPDSEWEEKEIEFFLVGDSFTHGHCVNRPNDISSVLRNLSNKSVLNLGIGGNGPLIQYAILREYLDKNVKKVLWIYFEGNDLIDLENEKKNNILINYLEDLNFTQNLKFKTNEIDSLLSNLLKKMEREKEIGGGDTFKSKLLEFFKIYKTRNLILTSSPPPHPASASSISIASQALQLKKILKLTKELTDKNNSKLYFVYLPEYNRYKIDYDKKNDKLVEKIVTDLKIPFINIHKEVFEKEQNPLKLFPFVGEHYNIQGYKKSAEIIYKLTQD